jgi:hypothetical protein
MATQVTAHLTVALRHLAHPALGLGRVGKGQAG